MTTVKDIYNYIDSFAPFDTAESYDNVGILVGDPQKKVTTVLAALDITLNVIQEAADLGAELIISHHPVIFNPLKKVIVGHPVYELIQNNISAICAHTNLDKSPVFGVNTELGKAMGLKNVQIPEENGILFTGNTSYPITAEEFAVSIKKSLYCESLVYSKNNNCINKVGFCSGAGGSEIFSAIKCGCDAFVTGEIKHHEIIAANENGVSVFVPGHYKTEDVVIQPLCGKLSEQFKNVRFVKSKCFDDKMEYII